MKINRAIVFAIIALLCTSTVSAQIRVSPKERRANKNFQEGSYHRAVRQYLRVLERNPANHRVKLKLAESYFQLNDTEKAEKYFSEVISKPFIIKTPHFLQYAQTLQSNGDFTRSMRWAKKYLSANPKSEVGQNLVFSLQHISQYYRDSSKYSVVPLNINTQASEFAPTYYGNGIAFSSSRKKKINLEANYLRDRSKYLDLFVTEPLLGHNMYTTPKKLRGSVNSKMHEGPATLTDSGTRLIFTRNQYAKLKPQQTNRLNLFSATRQFESDPWKNVTPLPFNNRNYSVGHPTMDPSGAVMYFVSNMPGGYGGTDIYKVIYVRGKWGVPSNLGPEINTPGNEMFPYIAENDILYFASNGHPGIGGLDIYRADLTAEKPVVDNLGFPINSTKDDFGLIKRENSGYFSSNRGGNDDIYRFNEEYRVIEVLVEAADLSGTTLTLSADGMDLSTYKPDDNGKVRLELAPEAPYEIAVESPGYNPEVILLDSGPSPDVVKLELTPMRTNPEPGTLFQIRDHTDTATYILTEKGVIEISGQSSHWLDNLMEENHIAITDTAHIDPIHYDFDESQVDDPYLMELNKLAALMNKYQYLEFQLNAHTDSRGPSSYNLNLSQQRASSAKDYLVRMGIAAHRLLAKGHGEQQLINTCGDGQPCARSMHLANRRTEFALVYMDQDQVVSNY